MQTTTHTYTTTQTTHKPHSTNKHTDKSQQYIQKKTSKQKTMMDDNQSHTRQQHTTHT